MVSVADDQPPQVYDAQPLLLAARDMKEKGNDCVKRKQYDEAVRHYESGISTLDKADGYPMLRSEVMEMLELKAVLYCNISQCQLNLELYRRAADAATSCLKLSENNVKALNRRCLALTALRQWGDALEDALLLQRLGSGAGLPKDVIDQRVDTLQEKKAAEEREKAAWAMEEAEDSIGMDLVQMKARFDEVVEKYDLKNDDSASEVADWLTSGEWNVTVKRVADRWGMTTLDAADFLGWIAKGLEFKEKNSENQAAMAAAPGMPDL